MKTISSSMHWPLLLLVVLFLAACGKEELVPPVVMERGATKAELPSGMNGTDRPMGAFKEGNGSDDGGLGIGDDGDDLGDRERNRKRGSN